MEVEGDVCNLAEDEETPGRLGHQVHEQLETHLESCFLTPKNRVWFNNTIKHFNLEGNQGQNESFIISSTNFPIGAKPIFDARRDKEHHSIYF